MDKVLSDLITISNTVGKDRALVQGVGGNTSVKSHDGKYTYIKASGTALKDMSPDSGWRRLKTESVQAIFLDKSLARMAVASRESEMVARLQSACDDDASSEARPSVESPLHVILDRCVIHLHALAALAYACAKDGRAKIQELFADQEHPPLWVPYADPGFSLGRKAFGLVRSYRSQHACNPSIMFLEKHGLLVASHSAAAALELVHKVIARCQAGLEPLAAAQPPTPSWPVVDRIKRTLTEAILDVTTRRVTARHFLDETVAAALARKDLRQLLAPAALSPDEMGFVNGPILWLPSGAHKAVVGKIKAALAKGHGPPVAFLVKDVGLLIAADSKMIPIIGDIVLGSLFIRIHARNMGGINPLNKRQRDFINTWEAEKFRVQLARR